MNKKQILAVVCSMALFIGTITVQGASVSDGDNNGDIVTNPWSDLFVETTTPGATTSSGVGTTPGTTTAVGNNKSEKVKPPKKVTIKKVETKKKSAKKVKLSIKKINKVNGYQVAIYKTKKDAKKDKKAIVKKIVKKTKITITSKKLKNKKTLYVRVCAYVLDGKKKVYGPLSKVKKIRIKK